MTDTFAQKLKAARRAAGLSQHGMADRMEIPFRTIQKWEIAAATPPPYVQRFVLNELASLNDRRVLCKNCKWYSPSEYTESGFYCGLHSGAYDYVEMDPDDFCSYATPKDKT